MEEKKGDMGRFVKRGGLILCAAVFLLLAAFWKPLFRLARGPVCPKDENGTYVISTKEDWEGFVGLVRKGEEDADAKLMADVYLNDISAWEEWGEEAPANKYWMIPRYTGVFDGQGYALIGYYAEQHPVFGEVAEKGCIKNLELCASYVASRYEYRKAAGDEDTAVDVNPVAGLCGYNYGRIENCFVEGKISGDGTAAGIVVYNGGEIEGCGFAGNVEAGLCMLRAEETLDIDRPQWRAGGIAAVNFSDGSVRNCSNAGWISLHVDGLKIWRDSYGSRNDVQMESCAGGVVGKNNGQLADCQNMGEVSSERVAGGIAGANSGYIADCGNSGNILLLPETSGVIRLRYFENEERVAAGISGYNTGYIKNCYHTGSAGREDEGDPGYVFGIAQNASWYFDGEGITDNCYYLAGRTKQEYRWPGIYKLSEAEMEDVEDYLHGEKALKDTEGFRVLYNSTDVAGTDREDYIRLSNGTEDYYLLKALGERDFWVVETEEGEDAASFAKKEGTGWLYVYYGADTVGEKGLSVLVESEEESDTWLKPEEEPAIFSSCIFFSVTSNEEGDLFAGRWADIQESIRESADLYLGTEKQEPGLRFVCYTLENGENLYGYSFSCSGFQPGIPERQLVDVTVFYRMREGLLAEFIGVEIHRENTCLPEAVRYLAACVDQQIMVGEAPLYDSSEYLGRENWDFPSLHNPFALVAASPDMCGNNP